jgi:hypothetical protein
MEEQYFKSDCVVHTSHVACIAKRTNQVDRFRKHWLVKPCQWFVFNDGGGCWGTTK